MRDGDLRATNISAESGSLNPLGGVKTNVRKGNHNNNLANTMILLLIFVIKHNREIVAKLNFGFNVLSTPKAISNVTDAEALVSCLMYCS